MNDSETRLIFDEIFGEEIYNRCGVSLHDDATVVDIGGNIGLFMLYVTQNYRRIKLYCFEPIPQTFDVLKRNRQLVQDQHQVSLFNLGVWKEKTTAVFRHLPRFCCSSTMCPDDSDEQKERAIEFTLNAIQQYPNRWVVGLVSLLPRAARVVLAKGLMRFHGRTQSVKCTLTTVSDIIRDNDLQCIDYLKLDAEGAEIEILQAIRPEDWPRIRQIAVETHRGEAMMCEVESILTNAGFETANSYSQSSPADKMVYGIRKSDSSSKANSLAHAVEASS